ncbi:cyclin-dependent kinases regulatory subunit 1-like [Gossypium australe]|uniref:Cyclin-dependent kinases regulatory subunit n=1 Tax=Gossypium australe TaxID=47621 RepID=A0A5B6UP82_9ROSI|nr:cyclin-dependent kinases regulatory subunit 1-like [Gossypium australe]
MGQIQYSEKYFDDTYEYRHVVLPPEVAKLLPKSRLLSEHKLEISWFCDAYHIVCGIFAPIGTVFVYDLNVFSAQCHLLLFFQSIRDMQFMNEWRAIGVQQSRGWVHYAIHRPEPHIMLFRRPLNYQQQQENQAQQAMLAK